MSTSAIVRARWREQGKVRHDIERGRLGSERVRADKRRTQVNMSVTIPGEAHAAEYLQRALADPDRGGRRPGLCHGRGIESLAYGEVLDRPCRAVGGRPARLDVDQQLRAQVLDRLEAGDGPTELRAPPRMLDRAAQRTLHVPDQNRRGGNHRCGAEAVRLPVV